MKFAERAGDAVLQARIKNLEYLCDRLFSILPGNSGCGDISRENSTRAEYQLIIREGKDYLRILAVTDGEQ